MLCPPTLPGLSQQVTQPRHLPTFAPQSWPLQIKYAGFIDRQQRQLDTMMRKTNKRIPDWVDYAQITTMVRAGVNVRQIYLIFDWKMD